MAEIIIPSEMPSPKTPAKNRKPFLIGLIVFFLLASGISVYGYTTQNWFISARQVYLETETKNVKSMFAALDTNFKTIEADYKPFLEDPVHATQTITANVTLGSSPLDSQTQFLLGILRKSKVTLDYSQDPKTRQLAAKIDLSVNQAAPITLQVFQDNDREGFALPSFYNKFLVANYSDAATIKNNLGIENIPQKMLTSADLLKAIKTSQAELTPIYEPYAKIYAAAIQKDQVKETTGEITIGDARVKGSTYTITFDADQAKNLVDSLAEQLSSDDQLVNLMYSKYSNLIHLYQASGIKPAKVQTKDDIKKSILEYAQELKTSADKTKLITMVIIVDDNGKIIERTVTETGTNNTFKLASWTADQQTNFVLALQTDASQDKESFNFVYTMKQQGDNQDSHVANFKLTTSDSQGNNQLSGSVTNDQTIENNGKSRTFNTSLKLDLDFPTSGLQGAVFSLNSTGKYDFGGPVTMPDVDAGKSLDLGKATQSDLDQYILELQQGVGTYLQREPALLQIFLPFVAALMI